MPSELTWVLTPFRKTHLGESLNRGPVCVHMHAISRTQKILTFMSWTGECQQQQNTQHAPSTKTECDYRYGWIISRPHTQKSHPKKVNPRDIAGNAEEGEDMTRYEGSRVNYANGNNCLAKSAMQKRDVNVHWQKVCGVVSCVMTETAPFAKFALTAYFGMCNHTQRHVNTN